MISTTAKVLLAAMVGASAVGMFFPTYEIVGPSTEPGLLNGDRVITLRRLPPLTAASIAAGDMVIVKSPLDGQTMAKRVIGLPGDVVEVRDNKIVLNGNELPSRELGRCTLGIGSRSWRCRVSEVSIGERTYQTSIAHDVPDSMPVQVPEGAYFILGDHLDSSNDSRNPGMGPVSSAYVRAVILATYWSSDENGMRWSRMFQRIH